MGCGLQKVSRKYEDTPGLCKGCLLYGGVKYSMGLCWFVVCMGRGHD